MTTLVTALGNYPYTAALKKGELTAPGVEFKFEEIKPVNRAFAPMAREQKFDVSEMAIVTYLLAKAYNKPIVLLPAVMFSRFQHKRWSTSGRRQDRRARTCPRSGSRVRSYTQTTGVWIRGIVQNDYGVDLNKASWTCRKAPTSPDAKDPPELHRISMEHDLMKMLLAGEVRCGDLRRRPAGRSAPRDRH